MKKHTDINDFLFVSCFCPEKLLGALAAAGLAVARKLSLFPLVGV